MVTEDVRVLVVDDNRDTVEALALLLEMDGYAVKTAEGGAQALDVIEEFDPICVLMDINMPDLDGHELSSRLRERYGRDITLIAVTGWGHADERIAPGFATFDHYLRKPVDVNQLKKLLQPV